MSDFGRWGLTMVNVTDASTRRLRSGARFEPSSKCIGDVGYAHAREIGKALTDVGEG